MKVIVNKIGKMHLRLFSIQGNKWLQVCKLAIDFQVWDQRPSQSSKCASLLHVHRNNVTHSSLKPLVCYVQLRSEDVQRKFLRSWNEIWFKMWNEECVKTWCCDKLPFPFRARVWFCGLPFIIIQKIKKPNAKCITVYILDNINGQ